MPAKFSADHPLWDEFIALRRANISIATLVKMARERGFDLSWHQIYNGMRRAPATFGLPTKSALWLAHKYAAVDEQIVAYKTMVQLLGESLERLQEMHVDAAEADTPLRRDALKHSYIPEEMNRAFTYAREITRLDLDIRRAVGAEAVPTLSVGTQNVLVLAGKDITEFSHQLSEAFVKQIGAPTAEQAALEQFGNENVRPLTEDDEPGTEDDVE